MPAKIKSTRTCIVRPLFRSVPSVEGEGRGVFEAELEDSEVYPGVSGCSKALTWRQGKGGGGGDDDEATRDLDGNNP